jgi:hypothetical protein
MGEEQFLSGMSSPSPRWRAHPLTPLKRSCDVAHRLGSLCLMLRLLPGPWLWGQLSDSIGGEILAIELCPLLI